MGYSAKRLAVFVTVHTLCRPGRIGIGIPPDLRVANTVEEVKIGADRQLEFAIKLLQAGGLSKRRPVPDFPVK